MGIFKILDILHTKSNSLVKDRLPLLSLYYYTKPRVYLWRRTQPLYKLFRGRLEITSTKKSLVFFTVHKSASTFFNWYLADLAQQTGHIYIDVNGYYVTQGEKGREKQKDPETLKRTFVNRGIIYGPLRNYLPVPEIQDYRVVLVLRDPRDVLTSQYFSIKNSHPLLTPELIKRRRIAKEVTIDEHVISQADRFVKTYDEYIQNVLGKDNVLFLKYENLIKDFRTCLQEINRHCELGLTAKQITLLDKSEVFTRKKEDQQSHIRKISAGDHKDKLKPETISILNGKFGNILKKLDYPL
jgi:hypothetical protein